MNDSIINPPRFEVGKSYKIRKGEIRRVISTNSRGSFPIIAVNPYDGGTDSYLPDGRFFHKTDVPESPFDLLLPAIDTP